MRISEMATTYNIHTDFSSGLLGPYMRGRIDLGNYNSGLQNVSNFLPTVQGPLRFREGFRFSRLVSSKDIRLVPFQISDNNRYLVALGLGEITVYDTDGSLVVTVLGPTYTAEELPYVQWHTSVDQVIFTHPKHAPKQLSSNVIYTSYQLQDSDSVELADSSGVLLQTTSSNTASPDAWVFSDVEFTAHPFLSEDTSGIQLNITDQKEIVRLETSEALDFSWSAEELAVMHTEVGAWYVEYKVNNQWSLGRVLTTLTNNEGVSAPHNPTGTACYVDPVDSVVNVEDKSSQLYPVYGSENYLVYDSSRNPDGVPAGEWHVRSDTLIWESTQIGSWVRCSKENRYSRIFKHGNASYNGADGAPRWFRIGEIIGVQQHPTSFVSYWDTGGTSSNAIAEQLKSGNVYAVLDWGNVPNGGYIETYTEVDRTGLTVADSLLSRVVKGGTSARFTAGLGFNKSTSNMTSWVFGDLSDSVQFDVVKASVAITTNLRSTVGAVRVLSGRSDPTSGASYTAKITASDSLFSVGRDEGRFLLVKFLTNWATLKISNVSSTTTANVDVVSSLPFSDTGDVFGIENGGAVTAFRLGAWYTDNWPSCVSFYERRQIYANTGEKPNTVWFSKTNDSADFRPIESDGSLYDTSAFSYPLGTSSSIVRWLDPGPTLVIGTESGEWQIRPNEFQSAITPENARIVQETTVGSLKGGVRIGSSVFFFNSSGRIFLEFLFNIQEQQFVTKTVTKLVNTEFLNDPIIDVVWQQVPNSTMWLLTESGKLYSVTYRKEDDFYAWSRHAVADAKILQIAVVPKGDNVLGEDRLWVLADRNGSVTLEYLAPTFTDAETNNYKDNLAYLDAHVRYPSYGIAPQATIPVPSHLSGYSSLAVVVDGVYLGQLGHSNGFIELPTKVTCNRYALVGLLYEGLFTPMPVASPNTGNSLYGKELNVSGVRLYLHQSVGYTYESDGIKDLVRGRTEYSLPMGQSPKLYTGFAKEHIPGGSDFEDRNVPTIKQTEPYPLTVVSMKYKVTG